MGERPTNIKRPDRTGNSSDVGMDPGEPQGAVRFEDRTQDHPVAASGGGRLRFPAGPGTGPCRT